MLKFWAMMMNFILYFVKTFAEYFMKYYFEF